MNPFDQLFNFRERCQHTLVYLHPYFAAMFVETRIVPTFLHIVYRDNNFYAQDFSSLELRQLVVSTSAASSATITTASATATGFLRTRLINLERTAFYTESVEFSDCLCPIISWPKFDKSETPRLARLPVRDDPGRDRLVAFVGE